jgi:hypothetical protein
VGGGIGASVVGVEGPECATPYFLILATCAATAVAAYLIGLSRRGTARMG